MPNKTKIEWCDYTINPVKGLCPMHCKAPNGYEYCYAAGEGGLYRRFKWNPEIRLESDVLIPIADIKQPSRIFIGSTMELFGDWIGKSWLWHIFNVVRQFSQHTFIFLTKKPENLARWSPFPKNCHIGVSVTNQAMYNEAIVCLSGIRAAVKFISFEPLLSWIRVEGAYDLSEVDWIILGGMSGSRKFYPPEEWIQDIEKAADRAGIPVFEKNNLRKVWLKEPRREMPE